MALQRAQDIAEATRAVNALIVAKKEETGAADVQAAEAELASHNEDRTTSRRAFSRASRFKLLAEEGCYHAALAGEKWSAAHRSIRALARETTFDQARFEHYVDLVARMHKAGGKTELPASLEGLQKINESYQSSYVP